VLSAAAESWPHIHISDSLVMADAAVKMAQAGCTTVAVLGVDFMSENVRAILDEAGMQHIKVGAAGVWQEGGGTGVVHQSRGGSNLTAVAVGREKGQ